MLIRSKLFRPGGSKIELGKGKEVRRYHFKPLAKDAALDDPDIEHVADVTDAADVATFVAITEGYEIHSSELKKPAAVAIAKKVASDADTKVKREAAEAAAATARTRAGGYSSMKKPDLIKLIAERTGKAPHGTTPLAKLIGQLEKLDLEAKQ